MKKSIDALNFNLLSVDAFENDYAATEQSDEQVGSAEQVDTAEPSGEQVDTAEPSSDILLHSSPQNVEKKKYTSIVKDLFIGDVKTPHYMGKKAASNMGHPLEKVTAASLFASYKVAIARIGRAEGELVSSSLLSSYFV